MVSQKSRGYNPNTFKGGVMFLITVDSLLCCAALCDIKSGKIPNVIPLVVLILGGIVKIENGVTGNVIQSVLLILSLCVVLVISYYFKILGGGDVKLLIMYSITMGVRRGIQVFMLSCLFCAIYALLLFMVNGTFRYRIKVFAQYVNAVVIQRKILKYPLETTKVAFGVFVFLAAVSNDLYLIYGGG
jgi:Flp pilus assembly protein protease CpaA